MIKINRTAMVPPTAAPAIVPVLAAEFCTPAYVLRPSVEVSTVVSDSVVDSVTIVVGLVGLFVVVDESVVVGASVIDVTGVCVV